VDPAVDEHLARSTQWPDELAAMRRVLLGTRLSEHLKWRKPCYVHEGANIVILQEMKGFLAAMFFKGALLEDPAGLLRDQGPNSRSAKRLELTSVAQIEELAPIIADYVAEAVEVERSGRKVPAPPALELADELQELLDADAALAAAFSALTPGRQREYQLHIGGAKQASTRTSRAEACAPKILAGKGLRDR
jgi:uncharacterized protein YdeI (YjbR/CyaY-like superfamily)